MLLIPLEAKFSLMRSFQLYPYFISIEDSLIRRSAFISSEKEAVCSGEITFLCTVMVRHILEYSGVSLDMQYELKSGLFIGAHDRLRVVAAPVFFLKSTVSRIVIFPSKLNGVDAVESG